MRKIIVSFLAAFMTLNAQAAIAPQYMDIKLPTQQVLEMQSFGAVRAADTVYILNNVIGPTSAAAVVLGTASMAHTAPDVARNLVIWPGHSSTTSDGCNGYCAVASCIITVAGTNYYNVAMNETFVIASHQSGATNGAKAFKTVSSISFPASCENAPYTAPWFIGLGTGIGLKNCLADAGSWFHSSTDGTKDATAAVLATNVSVVESNTVGFAAAPNTSKIFKGYFIQNFRCVK